MSNKKELEVSIQHIIDRFDTHIKPNTNTSIFFSGGYGTGKSTFLSEYFSQKEKEYYPVFLSPVNYVVSSNENIFELIKVDIIKQLYIDGHLDFDKVEINKYTAGVTYALQKPFDLVRYIANAASKLHPILEVAAKGSNAIHQLLSDLNEFQKKMNENLKSNEQELVEFAEEYLEFDTISKLLTEALDQAKGKKKSVLIIDDLDRLDPEHIFRILNIFSAHHDVNKQHKLGFDKVIIVSDIENLEKLFKHKYGEIDFDGYMDKFYSHEVFDFSNRDALIAFISSNFKLELEENALNLLVHLLDHFVSNGSLNIRNIIKYKSYKKPKAFIVESRDVDEYLLMKLFNVRVIKLNEGDQLWIDSDNIPLIYVIGILSTLFGRFKKLRVELNTIASQSLKQLVVSDTHSPELRPILLSYFISNYPEENLLPFVDLTNSRKNNIILMRYKNHKFWLKHNWRLSTPYTGDCSFYSKMKLYLVQGQSDEIHISISSLAGVLIGVMDYLERNSLLAKMDINE